MQDLFKEIVDVADDLTVSEEREWRQAHRRVEYLERILTARVLQRKGFSNREIAEKMGLSSEGSVRSILKKDI